MTVRYIQDPSRPVQWWWLRLRWGVVGVLTGHVVLGWMLLTGASVEDICRYVGTEPEDVVKEPR